jgi:shikimate kinase
MGAGKTTVGQLLAARLGWTFIDLDQRIEARSGRTVPQIFAESGEDTFRRYEQELTAELASAERIVLAPGGGWPLFDTNIATLSAQTAFMWLRVSPEEAVERLRGAPERPLLAGDDPLERARTLEKTRSARYAELGWPVETERRAPAEIANEIMNILGSRVVPSEPATVRDNG